MDKKDAKIDIEPKNTKLLDSTTLPQFLLDFEGARLPKPFQKVVQTVSRFWITFLPDV